MKTTTIHWFRQDLRLADNPALCAAAQRGEVLPIYILDDDSAGDWALGAASRVWLHHSLTALNHSLGGRLSIYRGKPLDILQRLIQQFEVSAIFWNRCYQPWQIQRDSAIKKSLKTAGINVQSFNANLLWEPWTVLKADGTPYKVFTPYYRKGCLHSASPAQPMPTPQHLHCRRDDGALPLEALALLPTIAWHTGIEQHWAMGEAAAAEKLTQFIEAGLSDYRHGRDFPAQYTTSNLSPHLRFGEISPRQIWQALQAYPDDDNRDTFYSELAWREFAYYLLYHQPALTHANLQAKFNHFPWLEDSQALRAWQRGQTGIPLVDAGMRELWQTGTMHNRVRMVAGSFLVKNLRQHWRHGQRWFWDCLVDADLASNSAGWQWVAGCGVDAAPYFRIFNPATQGQKFDPTGDYIRRYVPEIATLPDKYLAAPWTAPAKVLQAANVVLGETYPEPIVDLKASRLAALEAFKGL